MKLMYSYICLFSALTLIVCMNSCGKKTDTTDYAAIAVCSGTTPTYTTDIANILNTNCATSACHSASSAKSGINLSTYSSASSQFKTNSKNLISIHHGSGVDQMPKNAAKLSEATINKLDCWVKNGCPQ